MIHHVFANRANVGDWLSARGIQGLLAGLPITEHLCDEPYVEQALARLRAAVPGDLVVIGGGGLFMDYFDPLWAGLAEIDPRVPLVLWGLGYVDLKREPSRPALELVRPVVERSRLCVVRDELTRALLGVPGLPSPVPCPSLVAVEPAPDAGERGLLHAANYTTAGADVYEAMLAHGTAFARATGRRYRETDNTIAAGSETALAATLADYAVSDLVLSSRLHGCILAVALGRPVLAVSGDRKIESFMEAAGLSRWVCAQDEVDTLPERLHDLAAQPRRATFVDAVRAAHAGVARAVRALAAGRPAPAAC